MNLTNPKKVSLASICGPLALLVSTIASGPALLAGSPSPPKAEDDQLTAVPESTNLIDVLANDSDPDGDALDITVTSTSCTGTIAASNTGFITYTPDGKTQLCNISYTISDGTNTASAQASVRLVPKVVDDYFDVPGGLDSFLIFRNAIADNDVPFPRSITEFTQPEHGTVSYIALPPRYDFRPSPSFWASEGDSFTYTALSDLGTATATVYLTPEDLVRAGGDGPVGVIDITQPINMFATSILSNDTPKGKVEIQSVSAPSHGTATNHGSYISYTPLPSLRDAGNDTFTYTIQRIGYPQLTDTATIRISYIGL